MASSRSEGMAFPTVWRRFERKRPDGTVVKLKIQDGTVEMNDDLMEFMMKYFMRDETLNKAIGIEHEEAAVREFYELQSSYFDQNLSILCLPDDDVEYDMIVNRPPIIGFNLMFVVKRNAPHFGKKVTSEAMTTLFRVFEEMDKVDDAFERYGVDEILGDAGLSVHPDYRGLGVGIELLKARNQLCKAAGFRVSAAAFTGLPSQRAAEKCGYETYQKIPFSELEEITKTKFGSSAEYLNLMAYVVK